MEFDFSQVPYIKACVDLCVTAISGAKFLCNLIPSQLSNEEREILIAASATGHVQIVRMNSLPHVFAGSTMFDDDEGDTLRPARYRKAFQSLCARGYIEAPMEPNGLFPLAYDGWVLAKQLAQTP